MIFTAGRNIEPTTPVSPQRIALLERQRRVAEARILHPTPDTPDATGVGVPMRPDEFGERQPDTSLFESLAEMQGVAKVAHAIGYTVLAEGLFEQAQKAADAPDEDALREALTIRDQLLATEAFGIAGMVTGVGRVKKVGEAVQILPPQQETYDPSLSEAMILRQYLAHHIAA